ncbi:MAG: flagellar basal body L-ring protein FlgH [Endozoicomonas sp.]
MKAGWLIVVLIMLAGCQSQPEKTPAPLPESAQKTPEKPAVVAQPTVVQQLVSVSAPPAIPTGSLFNPRYSSLMVSDRRAYRLGDILTVVLEGNTDIKMGGGSNVVKNNTISIPDPTILGRSSASLLPGSGNSLAFDIQPSRDYGGTTSANRTNELKGNVAVRVVEVLNNGTLRIEGDKWLTINSNRERIRISGLVRPEDVSTDNTVSSNRLAEAKVDYVALGINADAHKPGWLTRMLNSPWFPF